jgi:ABC-2 type transport system permease protein
MAGVNSSTAADWPEAREQFVAIAQLRWRIFINSLRTLRGRLELVSWILVGTGYGILGLGGMAGLAAISWLLLSHRHARWFAAIFWGVLLYWQVFPLMAAAFTENFDSSNFLRFPLRYRSYLFIRMVYGALDPTTLVGSLWLIGIAVGIAIASPLLLPWAIVVLAAFWILNILLARMIFAWLERWLARRRTRELLGILFFLCIIGVQFVSPLVRHYARHGRRGLPAFTAELLAVQKALPPGLAAESLARAAGHNFTLVLGSFVLLCAYAGAFFWLLEMRLRAQYRGENLSEAAARVTSHQKIGRKKLGWDLPGVSGPVAAIFEKEFRYLSRSGPMLFTMVMPVVILLIFRFVPQNPPRGAHRPAIHIAGIAFPIGAAYGLLILTNLVYNCFGFEGVGMQFYFASPVRFREILLGKNIAQATMLALVMLLVWIGARVMFGPPSASVALATVAGIAFAAAVNFTVGDLMSLYSPKKIDFSAFGKQRAAGLTVLASFVVLGIVFGISAVVALIGIDTGRLWLAILCLLVLAALACFGYAAMLARVDRFAAARREAVLAELCRAS